MAFVVPSVLENGQVTLLTGAPGLALTADQEHPPPMILHGGRHGALQVGLFYSVFTGSALQCSCPHLERKYKTCVLTTQIQAFLRFFTSL